MFVTVIHRISDPDEFESSAKRATEAIPSQLKLHQYMTSVDRKIYPSEAGCRPHGICPTAPARISTWYVPRPGTRSMLIADTAVTGVASIDPRLGSPLATMRTDTLTFGVVLLGEILLEQEGAETAQARSMLEESLAIFKTLADRSGTAEALISLARLATSRGENAAAQAAYAESWTLLRAIGAKDMAARCLEGAGELATAQEMPERAVIMWGTAATLRAAILAPMPPIYRATYVAAVALAREKLGDETFQSLWTQGHQTPWEQVELFSLDR